MTALDDEVLAEVLAALNEAGMDVTYRSKSSESYDPDTGVVSGATTTEYTVKASSPTPFDRRFVDNVSIRDGDARILIPGKGLSFTPKEGEEIVIGASAGQSILANNPPGTTVEIAATQDITMDGANPDDTGNGSTLECYSPGSLGTRKIPIVRFPIISVPTGAVILPSYVQVVNAASGSTGFPIIRSTLVIQPLWTEAGTWNKYDGVTSWSEGGAAGHEVDIDEDTFIEGWQPDVTANATHLTHDIASQVTAAIAAGLDNYDWRPTNSSESASNLVFKSSETLDSTEVPKLILSYYEPEVWTVVGFAPILSFNGALAAYDIQLRR